MFEYKELTIFVRKLEYLFAKTIIKAKSFLSEVAKEELPFAANISLILRYNLIYWCLIFFCNTELTDMILLAGSRKRENFSKWYRVIFT